MIFDYEEKILEIIYMQDTHLVIAEQLLPSLNQSTVRAIQVLRYCRLQLLKASMLHNPISVFDIAKKFADVGVPEHICELIEDALFPHIENLECINAHFLENLELKLIGKDMLLQIN